MKEINVTFVHPLTGATLEASLNPDLTVEKVIEALLEETFIEPYECGYALGIDGYKIEGAQTLLDGGVRDGCYINIISCGVAKPVIYLYPQQKTEVTVSMNNSNLITVSYPEYSNGWKITANPDGTIKDETNGSEYSYLFWEAVGKIYDLESGYVVKKADLLNFLKEKLSGYGLLPKEYNEFIVYWYPILLRNECNAITFFCEEYEKDFELHIDPKPDRVFRIYMLYRKVDENENIPLPNEPLPVTREGFTVVEWGGQKIE